jgi:predicted secreted protein
MADVPEELHLRVGEEDTIRLPGLATAGYRWQAAVEDDRVATVSSRFDSGETTGAARTASSSRDELVTVSGRAAGTTRLSLIQRRSWEGRRSDRETRRRRDSGGCGTATRFRRRTDE